MKLEALKSEKEIAALFENPKVKTQKGPQFFWVKYKDRTKVPAQEQPFRAAISVSKKRFSKAVDRNRIKRQIREVLRESLRDIPSTGPQIDSLWVYIRNDFPDFGELRDECQQILARIYSNLPDES